MKLLTLNDIIKKYPWIGEKGAEVIRRELGINWIKNCDNNEDFTTNNMCGFYYDKEKKHLKPYPVFCEICKWIMNVFNITKQDLKEEIK